MDKWYVWFLSIANKFAGNLCCCDRKLSLEYKYVYKNSIEYEIIQKRYYVVKTYKSFHWHDMGQRQQDYWQL